MVQGASSENGSGLQPGIACVSEKKRPLVETEMVKPLSDVVTSTVRINDVPLAEHLRWMAKSVHVKTDIPRILAGF